MRKSIALLFLLGIGMILSCSMHRNLFSTPGNFPKPKYNFENNPMTAEGIELGRALFFDPILSADNTISCASCHSPYNSFSHTDHDFSHGIKDQIGNRNAPALMNLAWHSSMMWDGAVNHLDVQALAPMSNVKEMGENISNVTEKLRRSKIYPPLFEKAFHDTSISGEKILKAISQFELTLISADSKYDKMKRGQAKFSEQETKGYVLFQKNCNSCHAEPLFSTYEFKNNGLSVDTTLKDWGKYTITKRSEDSLTFKIPSLRNLSFTYPYMHDGRFKKLGQVLNHYATPKPESKTLAPELKNPIPLNSNEKADLIAFLYTLNDTAFVFNPNHQFPKKILNQAQGK